jgi:glucose-6-phosphate isomerase
MIHLKYEQTGVDTVAALQELRPYTERLRHIHKSGTYDEAESSLNLAADEALLEQVKEVASQKTSPALRYNIVVGIGGSNLGTKAVYDAIMGARDAMEATTLPKLLFAETTDPEWLGRATELIDTLTSPDEMLITLISKSGGTTETIANFEILMAALRGKFSDANVNDRVVAITDEGSRLWEAAGAKGMARLGIPKQVGGRYSVLSAVGLLPLLVADVDIANLRQGARDVLEQCLNGEQNLAAQSAAVLAAAQQKGFHINDNFFFHPELESAGKWYRQLMGESVGKEQSLSGKTVHAGITPTVSLGSTDLHSVGQLYLGGPKDKFTTFVSTQKSQAVSVPSERIFPELVPAISGKTAEDIMTAILEGVKVAYQKAGLPYMEVVLESVDEHSLGAYLQFKMLEMMYLGQLLDVNSFDQPNVEAYKVETKKILEG